MANTEYINGVLQQPISREHFREMGVQWEAELEALLVDLREATRAANEQWRNLTFLLPGSDSEFKRIFEWCEAHGVDSSVFASIGGKAILLPTDFGTTRESFWAESARIEAVAKSAAQ